jgi:pyruvate ferredoxin oxidoreductase gamma subunit
MKFNVRMAGVGGQGVVTASHVLSTAVIHAGGESTIVPFYGSEKRMAPVESYVRIASDPIYEIGEIMFPHIIAVFHPQVITHGKSYTNPFHYGIKDNGIILVNNREPIALPPDEQADLDKKSVRTYTFPATLIALETAGTDLATNMAIVGVLSAITQLTNLESLDKAVRERFLGKGFVVSGGTAALDSVEKNMAAVRAAWQYAVDKGWVLSKQKMAAAAV